MSDTREFTPPPVGVVQDQFRDSYSRVNQFGPPPPPPQPIGSKTFLVVMSGILGAIISTGTIVSVLGKAFYVDRSEYNVKVLKDAEDKITVQQTLDRLSQTLTRQEAAFEKLSDRVERIKPR